MFNVEGRLDNGDRQVEQMSYIRISCNTTSVRTFSVISLCLSPCSCKSVLLKCGIFYVPFGDVGEASLSQSSVSASDTRTEDNDSNMEVVFMMS